MVARSGKAIPSSPRSMPMGAKGPSPPEWLWPGIAPSPPFSSEMPTQATRYGMLITELTKQYYARGTDEFPDDLMLAYGVLINYINPTNSSRGGKRNNHVMPSPQSPNPEISAMTFVQQSTVTGTIGVTHKGITCRNCNNMGQHYSVDCAESRGNFSTTGTTLTQAA